MRKRSKPAKQLGQHEIFGDEDAAEMRSEIAQLRAMIIETNDQVHSQFTTIAAHAQIAREQADFAREEAHANLERTREMLIGLLEQVHAEPDRTHHQPGSAPGASIESQQERIAAIEARISTIADTTSYCFRRQHELADTMVAFLDTMTAQRNNEPVAGLSLR